MGTYVQVRLGDKLLWCEPEVLEEGGDGALAPPEHIRDGDLNFPACFAGDSYAHVLANGEIKRYRTVIGHRSDLARVEPIDLSPSRTEGGAA